MVRAESGDMNHTMGFKELDLRHTFVPGGHDQAAVFSYRLTDLLRTSPTPGDGIILLIFRRFLIRIAPPKNCVIKHAECSSKRKRAF